MLSGRSFRAQLVTRGQRELFDYWQRLAGSRRMPARSDIDPFSVPKLMPCIGLIDVGGGLDGAWFRLAGTRLHDVYGEEITGKRVDRVFAGARSDYWQRVHGQVVAQGRPVSGVVRGPAEGRDHVLLFWMRLPLSQDGNRVDRILCYDTAGPIEDALETVESLVRPYPLRQPMAWNQPRRAYCG
jgi:hypothetical protein